ncbi:unnamed protein product [Fraxinus pennsylvanica]|uniref:Fatty acyl-CoA reductase n=1 Tax=Fraxinus pennsylvanica TaxID=56036 RepID=A0AAD2E8M7_9LAMI|nr:unnamed protein product [Fraxinus pennsylvanica]
MDLGSILHFLEDKSILVTGATGFLAKIFVEKILRVQPNVKKLYLLLRAADDMSAMQRFNTEVYTKCGRRAMPTMVMGSAAVFIDCDESWKLLLVTRNGSLYVWDIFNRKCLLLDSLASLITPNSQSDNSKDAGKIKVKSAKLSKSGFPLVVLATHNAYLFDMSLKCWLRVADDRFSASNFSSSWNFSSAHGGELADLQIDVRKFLARKPGWSRSICILTLWDF